MPCPIHSPPPPRPWEHPAAGTNSFPAPAPRTQVRRRLLASPAEPRTPPALDKLLEPSKQPRCWDTADRKNNARNCRPDETQTRSNNDCFSCRWESASTAFPPDRQPALPAVRLFPAKQNQRFHRCENRRMAAAICFRLDIPPPPSGHLRWAEKPRSGKKHQSSWDPWRARKYPAAPWRCCCPAAPQ